MDRNRTIGFIGFGLIGGSLAKNIRKNHPEDIMFAYNYRKGRPGGGLTEAVKDGVLDYIAEDLKQDFKNCDIIFLCAPVLSNIHYLQELKPLLKPGCILTDVGSVKTNISRAAMELGLMKHFIGGHPMAGSEKTGYAHASCGLFENAYYIFTPNEETDEASLSHLTDLARECGAIPVILNPEEHDSITAAISHVPHIIASALVNTVSAADSGKGIMPALAAGGFRDITRIASSSPVMWQNICLTNRDSIRSFLDCYIVSLQKIRELLEHEEEAALYSFFESAKEYRDSLPVGGGVLPRTYELYVDILDRAGAIATLATQLSIRQISIKNIGILHNREYADGVLHIEFYDDSSLSAAVRVLTELQYRIYER